MAIDPERVKALFLAAIERDDPADRRAFLDDEVGDDAELRDRLDALLAAYDQPPGALDRPLAADPEATDAPDATRSVSSPPPRGIADDGPTVDRSNDDGPNLIDTIIADRYKIRQEIGEGGMGTVYLAEQLRPVRRQVALKLIKPGMDSRNVLARFESERQALALMEHPHIARVLDAGTTADGRPFFVMELVKGIPITEYCDAPPPRPARPARPVPPGLLGRAARAPEGDHPPRPQALEHPGRGPRRQAGPQGDRLRPGQGHQRAAADRAEPVHGLRQRRRHAAVHGAGAGQLQRAGRRHPGRHLRPGRDPLRAADRHDADRPRVDPAGGPGRDAAGDPRGRAADAVEPDQHVGGAADRWRPAGRSSRRGSRGWSGATWTGS